MKATLPSFLCKTIPRWSRLWHLLSGKPIMRNARMCIAFAPFAVYLMSYRFDFSQYRIALIGACLLVLSFIFLRLFAPDLIRRYDTVNAYLAYLHSKRQSLNVITEFAFLDSCVDHFAMPSNVRNYLPVREGLKVLNIDQSIAKYGNAAHAISDCMRPVLRSFLTVLLVSGIVAMYFKILLSVFSIIFAKGVQT